MEDRDGVLLELGAWIDQDTLAKEVIEELEDQDVEVTLATCKEVWLGFLANELHDGLRREVRNKER